MKNFKVSYYFTNDEDEVDFISLDFDAEDIDSLKLRLDRGDNGDYDPDDMTGLEGITDWGYFFIEDSDGNELFCNNNEYLKSLKKHYR